MLSGLLVKTGERARRAIFAASLVGTFGAIFAVTPWGMATDRFAGLEWLYALRGPTSPPPEVVIVNMSKRSIDRLGLPNDLGKWPRPLHAELIDYLAEQGAAVIVLDIFFRENRGPASDIPLAGAISRSKRTVLFQRVERDAAIVDQPNRKRTLTEQLMSPAAIFAKGAAGMGPFPLPKVPARVDQFWTFNVSVGDIPTLPVVALHVLALKSLSDRVGDAAQAGPLVSDAFRAYLKSNGTNDDLQRLIRRLKQTARSPDGQHLAGQSGNFAPRPDARAGLTMRGRLDALFRTYRRPDSRFINYYGPPGTIVTVPYHEVIRQARSDIKSPELAGKAVFVGVSDFTSTDGKDGFHTVFSRNDGIQLSGVEILATAFANLLQGNALRPLGGIGTIILVFVFGAVLTGAAILLEGLLAVGACLAIAGAMFMGSYFAFANLDIWLPVSVPMLVQLPTALLLGSITQSMWHRRLSERLTNRVGSFLPERIVRHITSGTPPEDVREVVYGICLFVDLRGYTSASEALAIEELASSTSRYYGLVDGAVEGSDGRGEVIRHSGDGAIALWNVRMFGSHLEMRLAACRAALAIRDGMAQTGDGSLGLRLPISIGLHEGQYLQGMLGEKSHLEHSVLGDTVNTTARIEGLNKRLGTRVLASSAVVTGLDEALLLRPLGSFQLMGKSASTEIIEVIQWLDRCTAHEADLVARFADLRLQFDAGRWTEAIALADEILNDHPEDGATQFFRLEADRNRTDANGPVGLPIVMDRK